MDIQKEREAFEASLAKMNIHNLRVGTIFDTEKNEYFSSDILHPSEDHIVSWINFSWKLWQQKAIPEGFVLVHKELPEHIAESMALERVEIPSYESSPTWAKISEDAYKGRLHSKKWELWRDYKEMIQAQEQGHE